MAYHVTLDAFEGPLDLLLHLISQARIEIREIFVSPIIDQYLAFMEQMPVEHMERTSEFVAMATRLLEIKSRWLLPKPKEREEEDISEMDLIRQLELYRQYKEASAVLRERKEQADLVYYRLPEERYREEKLEPGNLTLEKLIEAFERLRLRLEQADQEEPEDRIRRDSFTVADKVLYITRRLRREKQLNFFSLFRGLVSREEVIVTFLALLEMAKGDLLEVEQGEQEKDIRITMKEGSNAHGDGTVPADSGY